MSAASISIPQNPVAPRILAPLAVAATVIILALGALTVVFHNELIDTMTALASTQSKLSETQGALNSAQSDLAATQETLGSTQNELSTARGSRDAMQAQVDGLNANLGQLTAERDGLRADLDKARADVDRLTTDLQNARTSLNATSAERDTARSNLEVLGQAGLLMASIVKAYEDYEQVVDLQMHDLLASSNAAVRFDWTSQRYYIGQYNNRIALQNQKSATVVAAIQQLSNFIRTHPSDPGIKTVGTI